MADWQATGRAARPTGDVDDLLDPGPSRTQTTVVTFYDKAAQRAELAGVRRTVMASAAADALAEHQDRYMVMFRVKGSENVGMGVTNMLAKLADWGFAWRDIARMVGVSVPALQKWRKGDRPSPDNARKLADLVAGCEVIHKFNPLITDIAMWFEAPIVSEAPVTPIDLWATGNQQLVFEHARVDGDVDPYVTMDSFDSDWRERYRSDFETFTAADGEVSIRMRDR